MAPLHSFSNTYRNIYKRGESETLKTAIEHILAIELIQPSDSIWLVSPWISDLVVLDNRQYGYHQLVPEWPRGQIRLSNMFSTLLHRHGTQITVVTREPQPAYRESEGDRVTRRFLEALQRRAPKNESLRVTHKPVDKLDHGKGLLTDRIFLHGSMNLTFSGVNINGEHVRITRDPDEISTAFVNFRAMWHDFSDT
jgi:hypothetical protein